jgi:hypothetical protein
MNDLKLVVFDLAGTTIKDNIGERAAHAPLAVNQGVA